MRTEDIASHQTSVYAERHTGQETRAVTRCVTTDARTAERASLPPRVLACTDIPGIGAMCQFVQTNARTEDIVWDQTCVLAQRHVGRETRAVSQCVTTDARITERASHLPRVLAWRDIQEIGAANHFANVRTEDIAWHQTSVYAERHIGRETRAVTRCVSARTVERASLPPHVLAWRDIPEISAMSHFVQINVRTEDIVQNRTHVLAQRHVGREKRAVSRCVTMDARTTEHASHLPRVLARRDIQEIGVTCQFVETNVRTEDSVLHRTRAFAQEQIGREARAASPSVRTDARMAERASLPPRVIALRDIADVSAKSVAALIFLLRKMAW